MDFINANISSATEEGHIVNSGSELETDVEGEGAEYLDSTQLASTSVLAMAQSIGATLTEVGAAALGELAMKKLRDVTSVAIGFSNHENAPALRTRDFLKAEQLLNMTSYGHHSLLSTPLIRPIVPNINILDEGREIDLLSTISSPEISELVVRRIDPEFYVHQTLLNTRFDAMSSSEGEEDEGVNDEDDKTVTSNHNDASLTNHGNDSSTGAFNHVTNLIKNGPTPEKVEEVNGDELETEIFDTFSISSHNQYSHLDKEWLEYMEVFVNCFTDTDQTDESVHENRTANVDRDFQFVIEDLRDNPSLPIVDVICDFLCDYLNGLFTGVSSIALHRIVSVVDVFISGSRTPSVILMKKMSSILIEILVRPPGCEVQPTLVLVFMKILKNYDELLTWACSYITEVLKRTAEMAAEDISNEFKGLLHGALLLANGLELLNIKVAHEFGWDSSIADIKRNHYQVKEGKVNLPSSKVDGYLKEEFIKFEKFNSTGR